jgi:hypothetical protein
MSLEAQIQNLESLDINPDEIENKKYSEAFRLLLLGSAEGHEYPDLQVGDEVDPRLFLIPIKIYNIDPL